MKLREPETCFAMLGARPGRRLAQVAPVRDWSAKDLERYSYVVERQRLRIVSKTPDGRCFGIVDIEYGHQPGDLQHFVELAAEITEP